MTWDTRSRGGRVPAQTMSSVKARAIRVGAKYLITHPRSRLTRVTIALVRRAVAKRLRAIPAVAAVPPLRGSRLATLAAVAVAAGAIVLAIRRGKARASAPTETGETSSTRPTTPPPAAGGAAATPAAEAGATPAADGDDALVARVQDTLSAGAAAVGVAVAAKAGVVTLTGHVVDQDTELRFVRDAEGVEGVKAVRSELHTGQDEPGSPAS